MRPRQNTVVYSGSGGPARWEAATAVTAIAAGLVLALLVYASWRAPVGETWPVVLVVAALVSVGAVEAWCAVRPSRGPAGSARRVW